MARAQQDSRVRRVGVLMNFASTDAQFRSYLAAFLQGLRQLGGSKDKIFGSTFAGTNAMPDLREPTPRS
jgi:hypothetical protein